MLTYKKPIVNILFLKMTVHGEVSHFLSTSNSWIDVRTYTKGTNSMPSTLNKRSRNCINVLQLMFSLTGEIDFTGFSLHYSLEINTSISLYGFKVLHRTQI